MPKFKNPIRSYIYPQKHLKTAQNFQVLVNYIFKENHLGILYFQSFKKYLQFLYMLPQTTRIQRLNISLLKRNEYLKMLTNSNF